jgi:relaxin
LWLGLLLTPFSREEEEESRPRKLCGRHLLIEVIKLCGQSDWSRFEMEEQSPMTQFFPHYSRKGKAFNPHPSSSAWRRFTNPGKTLKGRLGSLSVCKLLFSYP